MPDVTGKVKIQIEHDAGKSFGDMAKATKPASAEVRKLEQAVDRVGKAEGRLSRAAASGVQSRIRSYRAERAELAKLGRAKSQAVLGSPGSGTPAVIKGAGSGAVSGIGVGIAAAISDIQAGNYGRAAFTVGGAALGGLAGAGIGSAVAPGVGTLAGGGYGASLGVTGGQTAYDTIFGNPEENRREEAEAAKELKRAAEELRKLQNISTAAQATGVGSSVQFDALAQEIQALSTAIRDGTAGSLLNRQEEPGSAEAINDRLVQALEQAVVKALVRAELEKRGASAADLQALGISENSKRLDVLEVATKETMTPAWVGSTGSKLQ